MNTSEEQLFDLATYNLTELTRSIYVRFFKAHQETGEVRTTLDLKTEMSSNPSIQEQRHRSMGKCYTLHPEEWIRQLGIYYIKMTFHQAVKIYFHRVGQFLDLSGRMGYKIYPGEKVQSQIGIHSINILAKLSPEKYERTCSNDIYDRCMYDVLASHMLAGANCTVPWIMSGSRNICLDPLDVNLTFWVAWDRVTNQKGDCLVPCQTLMVSAGAKNHQTLNQTTGLLYLYFAPRVLVSQEHYLYTFLSLMAEVGGYVGLLLGVSLFHLVDLTDRVIGGKIRKLQI